METRDFGRTGTALPVLGLGCQRLVDVSGVTESNAVALLNAAADAGVRYFDTAPVYGLGQAEWRLGILARERRADLSSSSSPSGKSARMPVIDAVSVGSSSRKRAGR